MLLFLLNFPKPHDVFMILPAKARTKKNDKSLFCATARVHHKFSSPLTWPALLLDGEKKGFVSQHSRGHLFRESHFFLIAFEKYGTGMQEKRPVAYSYIINIHTFLLLQLFASSGILK
ncbi:hypothetical protein CDAR_406081 [Caerostris darwini]|uniref:Uncharacterized protein n=1 Tax=Caerostris darwini TaxID=1538125 RepID=A0AAV4RUE1_9ARAC|nr:hypothetical protein CDAR_406081 [Caerostris darwini]